MPIKDSNARNSNSNYFPVNFGAVGGILRRVGTFKC